MSSSDMSDNTAGRVAALPDGEARKPSIETALITGIQLRKEYVVIPRKTFLEFNRRLKRRHSRRWVKKFTKRYGTRTRVKSEVPDGVVHKMFHTLILNPATLESMKWNRPREVDLTPAGPWPWTKEEDPRLEPNRAARSKIRRKMGVAGC